MAERPRRHSPLAGLAGAMAGAAAGGERRVALSELAFLAQVNLRADPADPAVASAIAHELGACLPTEPNTSAEGAAWTVLWLGPDEWLVVGTQDEERAIEAALRRALGDAHGSVVDVSASRTTLELRGPMARDVLMKGCALDLHPRCFGIGHCAQTALARSQVILRRVGGDVYRILVRGSFAPYLVEWLIDAMAEYGAVGPGHAPAPFAAVTG